MSATKINHLNSGLILASCLLAFYIPFELFLISYAVLGPLHYLTEISWLHNKSFFTARSNDYRILVALCVLMVGFTFGQDIIARAVGFTSSGHLNLMEPWRSLLAFLGNFTNSITLAAFTAALIMMAIKEKHHRIIPYFVLIVLVILLNYQADTPIFFYLLLFAFFLPTLIHVYIFTGAFMLFGALKSRSLSGMLSIGLFALCSISFVLIVPDSTGQQLSQYTQDSYLASIFQVNYRIFQFTNPETLSLGNVLYSDTGLVISRFIAFSYTYHYLNWFSKTSIIGWHNISNLRLATVVGLWLLAISLYAYDYKVGLEALFFLSLLHVYLEFPLNWLSLKGIGEETFDIVQSRSFAKH